ncbi:hypothetical protein [Lelliottia sp. JS-SCA-14]|uniref:hypothetical protein n=1 Tax=Lelliottia sp. JS-SCA-14 TaxID=3110110 RepID=UPI002D782BA2|nr:hypothetical protein [Lelliottia sp. JS-SCA-14]
MLSIHGTIAALAITFMSMFIAQVSEASEKDFVFICRQLVLREYKFYQFSVDAVCGLLVGVFFLVIGGGLIHYSLSMAFSLYFIYQYMKIFKDLYFITEKKELIEDILLRKIRDISEFICKQRENSDLLKFEFEDCIKGHSKLTTANGLIYKTGEAYKISPAYKENDKIISGYNKVNIKKLSDYLHEKYVDERVKLYLNPVFLVSNFHAEAYLICDYDIGLNENNVINKMLSKCFNYDAISEDIYFYTEVVSKTQVSTLNALLTNNEPQINFNINALVLLILNSQSIEAFNSLENYIYGMPSSKKIAIESMDFFYRNLIDRLQSDSEEFSNIVYDSMFSLPMSIYEKDFYESYIRNIHSFASQKTKFQQNVLYLETYIKSSLKNLLYFNLEAFKLNTEFLANEEKYFDVTDYTIIEKDQESHIEAMKSVLTYLHVLLNSMYDEEKESFVEHKIHGVVNVSEVVSLLKRWLNPVFLNDLFFHQMLYKILVRRNAKFSDRHYNFVIQKDLSQIITPSSLRYHESAVLALLFYPWKTFNNNLDMSFVIIDGDFIKANELNTNFIELIINFIESKEFMNTVLMIDGGHDIDNYTDFDERKERLLTIFNAIRNKVTNYYLNLILSLPYDEALMKGYRENLQKIFLAKLTKFVNQKYLDNVLEFVEPKVKNIIIEKREILPPLNDTTFAMSYSLHASRIINQIIDELLAHFTDSNAVVIEIHSIDDLPEKTYISINSLAEGFADTYKFHKNNVRANYYLDQGCFINNGFYYVCLSDNFNFRCSKENILDVSFMPLTQEYVSSANFTNTDLNIDLLARMKVLINFGYTLKEAPVVYFLSRENCLRDLEREEEKMRLLSDENKMDKIIEG